ncbi:type II secretion system F family protein [Campylobacter sp. RM9334]|uniref:type II secretion system F family protein n=1 Tax=unclassified Campylobacter TaxID=2593542 RepID=UPI001E133148|nr:type II secretion system F family protein [Campylobacter sp. MG1]MBZ8006792.1 type II secretion system F family protein [Campylobacter sp. RM9334]
MENIFILTLLFGFYLLYFGLGKSRLKIYGNKFLKSDLAKNTQKQKKLNINANLAFIFRNIYDKNTGLNRKNLIIFVVIVCVLLFINKTFLNLNVIIVFFASCVFGIYFINKLAFKQIKDDFDKNFPELLVVLNGAISAGSNVNQALQDCSNVISGVLRTELKIIVKALAIGDDTQKVFEASYKRLPFKNYYFFLTSLLVSLNSGARLKEILSRLATSGTKAKAMEKKKEAMTSEVRMSAKITAAIPFVFLFLTKFISPENFDFILYDEKGRYILYYFLGSELVGILMIMYLMRKI